MSRKNCVRGEPGRGRNTPSSPRTRGAACKGRGAAEATVLETPPAVDPYNEQKLVPRTYDLLLTTAVSCFLLFPSAYCLLLRSAYYLLVRRNTNSEASSMHFLVLIGRQTPHDYYLLNATFCQLHTPLDYYLVGRTAWYVLLGRRIQPSCFVDLIDIPMVVPAASLRHHWLLRVQCCCYACSASYHTSQQPHCTRNRSRNGHIPAALLQCTHNSSTAREAADALLQCACC